MSPIKVALIGNMNNNFFSLLRYLRDAGVDADLFLLNNEMSHFLPENDTWNLARYNNYIQRMNIGNPIIDFFKNKKRVVYEFSGYDFLIGCDYAPYYLTKVDQSLDLFIPYGSDLYEFPFSKPLFADKSLKAILVQGIRNFFVSGVQRNGILRAANVVCIDIIETYKSALNRLGLVSLRWPVPIVYNESKPPTLEAPDVFKHLIKKIESFEFRILSQSRQYWTTSMDKATSDDIKNNDLLIIGFANFLKIRKSNACLILFSYGPDVDNSKALIEKLGITDNVIWMPKMARKWILYLITEYAHIGADQFKGGYFGGTGYEILASGKPLMNTISIKPEEFKKITGMDFPPVINVRTHDEICEALAHYFDNPFELQKLSSDSKLWFNKNLGEGCAARYVKYFEEQVILKREKLNVH